MRRIVQTDRNPIPERIVWQPVLAWKHQFYWLSWDRPALNAILQADLDRDANKVAITCSAPTDGLWVLLDDRVLDLERAVTVTVNDVEVFSGIAEPSLATMLRTSRHPDPGLQFVTRVPAFARDRD